MADTTAKALNCPNCGAAVASDSSLCQFCKTRLKTVACPQCFGLMFVGNQFCGQCGAIAAPLNIILDDMAGECPRCRRGLEQMAVGTTNLRGCANCDGIWLAATAFESICAERERQSAVLGFLQTRSIARQQLTKINYVPCPDCGNLMNRNNFAKASGVIVDVCRDHGVWFDADELPAIIKFVQAGGMEISRQRERDEIRNERDRLRDERFAFGDMGADPHYDHENSLSIRAFIRGLFE